MVAINAHSNYNKDLCITGNMVLSAEMKQYKLHF